MLQTGHLLLVLALGGAAPSAGTRTRLATHHGDDLFWIGWRALAAPSLRSSRYRRSSPRIVPRLAVAILLAFGGTTAVTAFAVTPAPTAEPPPATKHAVPATPMTYLTIGGEACATFNDDQFAPIRAKFGLPPGPTRSEHVWPRT